MNDVSQPVSRRGMLLGAAIGVGALAAAAVPAFKLSFGGKSVNILGSWWQRDIKLATAGQNDWAREVGTRFLVDTEAGVSQLALVAVEPLPSLGKRPKGVARTKAFVAKFEAVAGALPSGDRTYSVRNPKFKTMDVYFSEAFQNGGHTSLQAVFN